MDQRIRTSDADRDRVAERLRDHFAEGRLTPEELDERLTATLSAKTFGDLGRVLADLPESAPAPLLTRQFPAPAARPPMARYRGPRLFPLALLVLLAAVVLPGAGWLLVAVLKVFLIAWLAASVAGILLMGRFRSRMRRAARHGHYLHQDWPGAHPHQWCAPRR